MTLTLTAPEYEIVWDDVANASVGPQLVPVAVKLLGKLSEPGVTQERPFDPELEQRARDRMRHLWASRWLTKPEHAFELDVMEAELLAMLVERAVSNHPIICLPTIVTVLEKVADAVKAEEKE